jgi:hypothetical protein
MIFGLTGCSYKKLLSDILVVKLNIEEREE